MSALFCNCAICKGWIKVCDPSIPYPTVLYKDSTIPQRDYPTEIEELKEKLRVACEALEYYANDPAFDEKTHIAFSSNFRSNNCANQALAKIRGGG